MGVVPLAESGLDERPPALLKGPTELAPVVDRISRLPTCDDYPLWRVCCRVFITGALFRVCNLFIFFIAGNGRRTRFFFATDSITTP